MSPETRGTIYHAPRAAQLRDFQGLRWGTITPTDIDGFLDFGRRAFVFVETKTLGADLPAGQRLALERLADACQATGIHTLALVAVHLTPSSQPIDVSRARVTELRYAGRWMHVDYITVRAIIDRFLARFAPDYLGG